MSAGKATDEAGDRAGEPRGAIPGLDLLSEVFRVVSLRRGSTRFETQRGGERRIADASREKLMIARAKISRWAQELPQTAPALASFKITTRRGDHLHCRRFSDAGFRSSLRNSGP